MNRGKNGNEDLQVEQLLAELGARAAPPDEGELRAMARAAAGAGQLPQTTKGRGLGGRRPLRIRWIGAAAGVALLVGSGLGFGLGGSFTPSGSAGTNFAGTGFLPARGWTVLQTGTVDAHGASRAIAANVPLRREDDAQDIPYATVESLPPRGVVIVAAFATRGDPGADIAYPIGTLPLRIATAERVGPGVYLLRAGIRGTNIDARVFFGISQPPADVMAATQRQLNRLVVGAEDVTLFARPTVISATDPWTTLFGSVDSSRSGETVTIQARDCGSDFFRVVDGATTRDGGGWSATYSPGISTTLRAVWSGKASNEVSVRQRPWVSLRKRARTRFEISAGSTPRGGLPGGAQASFWGRRVLFQRFDRRLGRWLTVRRVRLTENGPEFPARLPRGTLVRAVLPLSQARPCYLAGVSFTVRT